MSLLDKLLGRTKKAAGDLAGDPGLRREGRLDERRGEAKEELDSAQDEAARRAAEVERLERE